MVLLQKSGRNIEIYSFLFDQINGVNEEQLNYIIEPLNMYSRLMNTRYKHLYIRIYFQNEINVVKYVTLL